MGTYRNTARQAGDRLGNVQKTKRIMDRLTPEERDWVALLRDRFYEIQRRPVPQEEE